MKNILALSVMVLAIPLVSFGAVYDYIDLTGKVQSVEAINATHALFLAQGNALHSGVKIDQGTLPPGQVLSTMYMYVDVFGNIKTVNAADFDSARLLAINIAPNSGLLKIGAVR